MTCALLQAEVRRHEVSTVQLDEDDTVDNVVVMHSAMSSDTDVEPDDTEPMCSVSQESASLLQVCM